MPSFQYCRGTPPGGFKEWVRKRLLSRTDDNGNSGILASWKERRAGRLVARQSL
ncbi:MAG: hypothetical protein ACLFN2_06960 [Bacteroidales bacterium]